MNHLPLFLSPVLCATLVIGCQQDIPRDDAALSVTLRVHTTQRTSFDSIGLDTLSDSATVRRLTPEPDGEAIVALISDPHRGVSSALVIADRRRSRPELLWPDSVTAVSWIGVHRLAFSTRSGVGIRVVIDVHAESLIVVDSTTGAVPPSDTVDRAVDAEVRRRAVEYVDSVHVQPAGALPESSIEYNVTRFVPALGDSLVAFYVVAHGGGTQSHPSWYVMHRGSGAVARVDQITGLASELPVQTGAWSGSRSFFYVKGQTLWEAEVTRE
jgi:hypothetical protein